MPRREYGLGTVYERAGRWQAQFELAPGPDGKRRRRTVSGATRAEAVRKLEAAKREAAATRGAPDRQALGAYLETWLEEQRDHLRASTLQRYRELARHLAPLARIGLGALKPADVRACLREAGRTLAPRTVVHVHRLLHKALEDAVREELLGRNVCDLVRPPAVAATEPRTLDLAEARRLLETAKADRFAALWLLAVCTGMREGELLALRWADLDRARGTLTIRRSIRRVVRQGWQETPTKTRAGQRRLVLPAVALTALAAHRERQEAERRGQDWHDMGLIFPSYAGTPLEATNLLRRHWRPLLERAGLPRMRLHDLRHSAVSLLLAAGVPPHTVQSIVGHADARTTMAVYAHSRHDEEATALARLADRLAGDG